MRYLDAVERRPLDRPPIWFMRQAGRYLPEYRAIREHVSFQDAIADPQIASEITLAPIDRFGFDAAIIFADIMTPVEAMGVEMTFAPGPRLDSPISSAEALHEIDMSGTVDAVLHAETLVRSSLHEDVALIGFSGGPFTLAAYLCGGGSGSDFIAVRQLAHEDPSRLARLLDTLGDSMNSYLRAQFGAGVDAVQIFDSWAGMLTADQFRALVRPSVDRVLDGLDDLGPVTYFAPQATHLYDEISALTADVIGVDWRSCLLDAWGHFADRAIQGNLDPSALAARPDAALAAVRELLTKVDGRNGHILNVGHGLRPETRLDAVACVVDFVKDWSGP